MVEVLQKRLPKWILNPSWYVLCKASEENRNHLFYGCPYNKGIWEKVGALLHHQYNFDNTALLCKHICRNRPKSKKQVIHLNMAVVTLWSIWLERNKRIFNGKEKSLPALWEDIQALIGLWTSRSPIFKNSTSSVTLNLNVF